MANLATTSSHCQRGTDGGCRGFIGRLRRRPPDEIAAGAVGEAWMPSGPSRDVGSAGHPCPTADALAFAATARVVELVRHGRLKSDCPLWHEGSSPSPGIPTGLDFAAFAAGARRSFPGAGQSFRKSATSALLPCPSACLGNSRDRPDGSLSTQIFRGHRPARTLSSAPASV